VLRNQLLAETRASNCDDTIYLNGLTNKFTIYRNSRFNHIYIKVLKLAA